MILTDTEISECLTGGPKTVARMIEAAVLAKLAQGVSVEPDVHPDAWAGGFYSRHRLTTAIAAARVAENERCANWLDERGASAGGRDLDPYRLAIGIRALKGGAA